MTGILRTPSLSSNETPAAIMSLPSRRSASPAPEALDAPNLSRSSSRLSTDTFGCWANVSNSTPPPMSSPVPESWHTAPQSTSQIAFTTAPDHEADVPSDPTPPSPASTTVPATHYPHNPHYHLHIASMPDLSRSTSTVNPSTPSTVYFPRLESNHGHPRDLTFSQMSHGHERRSTSLSSMKESLVDEKQPGAYHEYRPTHLYDDVGPEHLALAHAHPHTHDHVHVHEASMTTEDGGEWEDIDTHDKEAEDGDDTDDTMGDSESKTDGPPAWTTEMPTAEQVHDAAGCHLIDQWGKAVRFGDMLPGGPAWRSATLAGKPVKKLLTLFVGHWWCGLCHEYAIYSVSKLSPAALVREGVRVVIISSGSWKVIAKYRELFDVKYPVFVDNGTRLYKALGMRTSTPNPFAEAMVRDRPSYHHHKFARQMATGMAKGIFRLGGIKLQSPGSFTQLGGEFVFGENAQCEYVHRMTGRGDHCEATDVLGAVGVNGTLGEGIRNPEEVAEDEAKRAALRTRRSKATLKSDSKVKLVKARSRAGSESIVHAR